jgi:hypothetical protein
MRASVRAPARGSASDIPVAVIGTVTGTVIARPRPVEAVPATLTDEAGGGEGQIVVVVGIAHHAAARRSPPAPGPGSHPGRSEHQAHNGLGVRAGSVPAANRHNRTVPGQHPLQGAHEDVLGHRFDVELPRPRVVGGDPKGRGTAAQGLEQGVEVEIPPVLDPPPTRLDLHHTHRRPFPGRSPEGQVDDAAHDHPAPGQRHHHPFLGPGQPGSGWAPATGPRSPAACSPISSARASRRRAARVLDEGGDPVPVAPHPHGRHGVGPRVVQPPRRHPLPEQGVDQAPPGQLLADHPGGGPPGHQMGLAGERPRSGLLAHPHRHGRRPPPPRPRRPARPPASPVSPPASPGSTAGRSVGCPRRRSRRSAPSGGRKLRATVTWRRGHDGCDSLPARV